VRLRDDTASEPGPQRIFIGEADVLTAADACVRLVARLRSAGQDATITTFAGAHHAFDAVATRSLTRVPDVLTAARCNLEEGAGGAIVNSDTGRELDELDRCIGKGLIAGYDESADAATKAAVKALLNERFRLGR
jgi:dienelactone hydrolase